MPTELLKEFIGKECIISLTNENKDQIKGIILETESYWIKIKEEDSNRIINGLMIRDIKIIASNSNL